MPSALKRRCLGRQCPELVDRGYCPKCQPTNEPGVHYGRKWRKARTDYLIAHPFCVQCEQQGQLVLATDVDHRTPHRGRALLFWDQANWQSLCKTHHGRKTATEDGGFQGVY